MPDENLATSSDTATPLRSLLGNMRSSDAARITLPEFLPMNPKLWIILVEQHFKVFGIENDTMKLTLLSAKLPQNAILSVDDLLTDEKLTPTQQYASVKQRLIQLYNRSEEEKLSELLSGVALGNRKPSALLNEMRILAGNNVNEGILKRLWLNRLPTRIQEHLLISQDTLEVLSTMADQLAQMMTTTGCHAIEASTSNVSAIATGNGGDRLSRLEEMVLQLTKEIGELKARPRSFSRNRFRTRSRGPTTERTRSPSAIRGKCYYHYKFGEKAFRCRSPCDYTKDTSAERQSPKQEN